jgi:tetratricopeptide (TPR) repeat protein
MSGKAVRRPVYIIAALVCAGCLQDISSRLDRARDLTRAGRPRDALIQARAALAALHDEEGRAADALRVRALALAGEIAHLYLDNTADAVELYGELVESYPKAKETFTARARLGDIYRDRLNDPKTALMHYGAIARDFADHAEADQFALRAARVLLYDLREPAEARATVDDMLLRWPASERRGAAAFLRASSYLVEGDREKALQAFQDVGAEFKGTAYGARALQEAGGLYAEKGEYRKAIEAFLAALNDHPEPIAVQYSLERVRMRMEKTRPADPSDRAAVFDHHRSARERVE